MPIYEYYCSICDVRFNVLQKIDASAPACPRCGGAEVRKLISGVTVVHSDQEHEARYRQQQTQIDTQDSGEVAGFFRQQSTELSERMEGKLTGSDAFAELLDRVSDGVSEADMGDLEDALVEATGSPYKLGEQPPEPGEARFAAHSQRIRDVDEREVERENARVQERKQREGHEGRGYNPEDDRPHDEEALRAEQEREAARPPASPWSSKNIGWG